MMPIFVLVSLFFYVFAQTKCKKLGIYDIKAVTTTSEHQSNLSFPQAFYVSTFFIEIEVLADIMRKSLSAELRHGKLS